MFGFAIEMVIIIYRIRSYCA